MNKINLEDNEKMGLSNENIIKNFFAQVYGNNLGNFNESTLEVIERSVDPRLRTLYVYAVCSQEEIDKLISFESDYLTYKKEIKKIDKLKNHKSMKFEIYNINYKEYSYRTQINFIIVKDCPGAWQAKKVIVAEDDLYYAKVNLDNCDVLF